MVCVRTSPTLFAMAPTILIAIRIVGAIANNVGLVLTHTIQINDAVVQAYSVAWHADDALYQVQTLLGRVGGHETRGVAPVQVAIGKEPAHRAFARGRKPVHENVIAYEQSLFHGARGNLEMLDNEGENI